MSDLIDRQAAIDEIEHELEMINSALDSITLDFNARERLQQIRDEAREILNSIQKLPSAQHTGRWIGRHERGILSNPDSITYECSECGYSVYTVYGMPRLTNFCPWCGAEMKGEEE